MAQERRTCAAVVAQTGKPCTMKAAEGAIVCKRHLGPTKAMVASQKKNLASGQKKRKERLATGKQEKASERWAKLLDGTLSVRDLDEDEIEKMRVRGKGGEFSGRAPAIPSHLAREFRNEGIRRATEMFHTAAPKAVKRLLDIADDPDTKDADAIRALDIVLNRGLGKTPEVIRVEASNEFERVAEAIIIDRGLASDAEAFLASKAHGKNGEE